jgi:hypothetical protein
VTENLHICVRLTRAVSTVDDDESSIGKMDGVRESEGASDEESPRNPFFFFFFFFFRNSN